MKQLVKLSLFFSFMLFIHDASSQSNRIDSLNSLIKVQSKDTVLANIYIEIGREYAKNRNLDSADMMYQHAVDLSRILGFLKGESEAFYFLGVMYTKSKHVEARQYFLKSLDVRKQLKDVSGISKTLGALGIVEIYQSNYDSALTLLNLALDHAIQASDTILQAKALINIASAYFHKDEISKGIDYSLQSLRLSELVNDSLEVAMTLGNIGSNYQKLQNDSSAKIFLQRSLAMKLKNGQRKDAAATYTNLGNIFYMKGEFDSALTYYFNGLRISLEYKGYRSASIAYQCIAASYIEKEKYDSAIFYIDHAFEQIEFTNDSLSMASNLLTKGEIYSRWGTDPESGLSHIQKKKYYRLAEESLDKSLSIGMRLDLKDLICKNYLAMSELQAKLNNYDMAYESLNKYIILNDSIRNSTFTRQIAEMQTKYETGKKENEIHKLNAEKTISSVMLARRRTINYSLSGIAVLILLSSVLLYRNIQKKRVAEKQVAILEKQNAIETMRGKIASDVHDDMGAGLTKMGLFSEQLLQSTTVSEKEKELLQKISGQSKEVINGMREIIWASNPANDTLKSMLGFMRQYIDRFFDGTNIRPVVNFPHNIGEVSLHPEVRRNLFLILKESLNNAVKYSGSDKVDIDFNSEAEKFNLRIKDYGKGIDDKNKDAFSSGLRNMQKRADQIQSAFQLISVPGKGVQIVVAGKLY